MNHSIEHSKACGCGHDHDHEHKESHEHNHDHSCGCGHDHDHEHEESHEHHHDHSCGCGCDHDHEESHEHHHVQPKATDTVYLLEGLGCANCAAKIETKIRQLPEVEEATLTFATKQLRISTQHDDVLLAKLQEIVDSIEDGVTVVPKENKKKIIKKKNIPMKKINRFSISESAYSSSLQVSLRKRP